MHQKGVYHGFFATATLARALLIWPSDYLD